MAEISNKTLALLLIAAIIISLGGTFLALNRLSGLFVPRITGLAGEDTGALTLTILENINVNFTIATMAWGSGAVDAGKTICLLQSNYTNGSAATYSGDALSGNNCTDDDFDSPGNFVVENKGNRNVTLNITGGTAATLFEVSGGIYRFNITNPPDTAACVNSSRDSYWDNSEGLQDYIPWTAFNGTTTANEIAICNETGYGMRFIDGNDTFYINLQLMLPYDAFGGLSDTITLEATSYTK